MNFGKVIAGFGLLVLIGVCGCGAGKEKSNPGKLTRLNEQQIEILEQEGLPTDIEKLSASQKRCIMKIDEMMNYMEETYGEEFVFDGFNEAEILDKWEKIYVYRAVDTDKTSSITVKRKWENGEWVYEDEYLNDYEADYWKNMIKSYLKNWLEEDDYVICCYATVSLDATKEDIDEDFKKCGSASAYLYVDGGAIDEKEYEYMVDDLRKWATKEEFRSFSVSLIKDGMLKQIEPGKWDACEKYQIKYDDIIN